MEPLAPTAQGCPFLGNTFQFLGFLMYEILTRPELMRKLVDEVDQHFAEGIQDAADLRDLRLLRATYLENLRFHPVSQGMPFLAERDFAWSGKRIEKGDRAVVARPSGEDRVLAQFPGAEDPEVKRLLRKRLAADHLLEALPELKAGGAPRWLPEFESRTVPAGTVFVREGEPATELFVITAGEVVVEQGTVRELARLCAAAYFGEIALFRGTPRTATVRAASPEVTVLVLDAAGFRRLIGESGGSRGDLALALYRRIT